MGWFWFGLVFFVFGVFLLLFLNKNDKTQNILNVTVFVFYTRSASELS